ncbi:MAG: hypothetical protein MJE63_17900 [Proteobacteria bacterium]|nr:hypothetical protein [Pseudomonadota bacterium]
MINILAKNWQFIITIFPAMFVLYKFYLQRMDTRIERKTKDLETIDTIITNLPSEFLEVKNNLLILSTTEKLNAFFKTKFDQDKILACLKTENPAQTIKVVKNFNNLIKINNGELVPTRMLNPQNRLWVYLTYLIFIIATVLGFAGFLYPELWSDDSKELPRYEEIAIRILHFGFSSFIIKEYLNLSEAIKFFKKSG